MATGHDSHRGRRLHGTGTDRNRQRNPLTTLNPIVRKALDAKLLQLGVDWLRVETLVIRSADRSVFATIVLEGEDQLVELTMFYQLEGNEIVIESIEASKAWISKAIRLALTAKGNRITLPSGMPGMAVRMLL